MSEIKYNYSPEFILVKFLEDRGSCFRLINTEGRKRILTAFKQPPRIYVGCNPKDIVKGSLCLIVLRNEKINKTYDKRAYPMVERLVLLNDPKGAISVEDAKQMILRTIQINRMVVCEHPENPLPSIQEITNIKTENPEFHHILEILGTFGLPYGNAFKRRGITTYEKAEGLTIYEMKEMGIDPKHFQIIPNLFSGVKDRIVRFCPTA